MKFCLVSALTSHGKWTTPANEIRSWAYTMDGDVRCGFGIQDYTVFDAYDVTMVEMTLPMVPIAMAIKEQSRTKVVALIEGTLMPNWTSSQMAEYMRVLNRVDLVGIINDKAYEVMRPYVTAPIHNIGIPFPIEWATQHQSAKHALPVVELGSSPENRGGIYTMAAFREMNARGVCYPCHDADAQAAFELGAGSSLYLRPRLDWQPYFVEHSANHIGIHLDDRATWGRFSLDCAAAGMPCVSTSGSHTQRILFPDLTVEYWEIEKAVSLYHRLLEDTAFRSEVVDYAREQIKQFDIAPTRARFLNLI